ncbi:hypothetical protein HHI36_003952 [Cryptolaemus montrouzieri]|uniref:Uncharacterized protein n=1 Tax=Cryptolaemus montrouzieri TaxID=559131 RepID=A0ABD2NPP7_9CUCU
MWSPKDTLYGSKKIIFLIICILIFHSVLREEVYKFKIISDDQHGFRAGHSTQTGIQVNNKLGKVLATKGDKEVYTLTSSEKGENVSVIACCSAEGYFMPPVLIFTEFMSKKLNLTKRKKDEITKKENKQEQEGIKSETNLITTKKRLRKNKKLSSSSESQEEPQLSTGEVFEEAYRSTE